MAPPLMDVAWSDSVDFVLNGRRVTLRRPRPDMTLVEFLRDDARLTGTKLSCGEGGCGACTVVLCHHPLETVSGHNAAAVVFRAVNACLFPVCALDGIQVFTVEGIGSLRSGLHAVQHRLANADGSQCGFCTPGMVMNMYELLRNAPPRTHVLDKQTIEDHFDGNLCRCTGYRPIFEAFHSFAAAKGEENDREKMTLEYEVSQKAAVAEILTECEHLDDWLLVEGVDEGRKSICEARCGHAAAHKCSKLAELEDLFPQRMKDSLVAEAPYDAEGDIKPSNFVINFKPKPLKIEEVAADGLTKKSWYRPLSLEHLESVFKETCLSQISFVGGRTAHGVSKYYNNSAPYNRPTQTAVQIELNYIAELKTIQLQESPARVVVGSAVTLNTLLAYLTAFDSDEYDNTAFQELASLIHRVANNQVRNAGTWAGNLSLCREHPAFVSDVVVGLMGIGATLTLTNEKLHREENVSIEAYSGKPPSEFVMILSMELPLFTSSRSIRGYVGQNAKRQTFRCDKVAQRPQNSHSHVNCAIWLSTGHDQSPPVCLDTRIVFGGVCKHPARFHMTEKFLAGSVLTQDTLSKAIGHLEADLKSIGPSDAFGSATFRLAVMKNLLYKCFLSSFSDWGSIDSSVQSAPSKLLSRRAISSGTQSFKPCDSTTPVSKPIPKIGAKMQATGEAKYTLDKELTSSALYGAILYSREALATLISIDRDSKTRSMEGVIDIITALDIRGANDISAGMNEEQLFVPVGGVVRCRGAPIGLIVATTPQIAELAVSQCEVEYGQVPECMLWQGQTDDTPILNIDQAVEAGTLGAKDPIRMGDDVVEDKLRGCKNVLSGSMLLGAQKHFYMEPQNSVVSLQEGGVFLVETSSQFPQFVQQQLASVLSVKYNNITVQVQRVGGGFGGKLTRCVVNAAAAAVAAQKHHQTVRVLNDRGADFRLVGGRENMRGHYTIGFDDHGYIQALDMRLDVDCGYTVGDSAGSAQMAVQWSDSAYHAPSFRCRAFLYLTNTQTCTSHRAPGVPQSLVLYEAAMHHVAETLNLPMRWIQERNLYKEGDRTPYGQLLSNVRFHEVWDRLLVASYMEQREEAIEIFNSNNKWKKRGIAMTPTKYGMQVAGRKDASRVEIFAGDGSVIITHGGCEIGQGIHTKAVQVCAFELGIPMELISVRPTSTDQTPNSDATGGSSTSESIAQSIIACCAKLKKRIQPFYDSNPSKTWAEIVKLADTAGVCLFASAQPFKQLPPGDMFDYYVYAAACSEVEVDVLTGEINIKRAELVYDCGISLNPAIDIGQIEGGFVMGIGLYLQEDVVYGDTDGELLTQGTWEYKVPCSKDIPEKFEVTLLENANNTSGVLNSKATGEPPYALATSVYFAVKKAIMNSRLERGNDEFFHIDVPATVQRRLDAAMIDSRDYDF